MAQSDSEAGSSVISIAIKDKAVLYAAYMPFIKDGGLFVPTKKLFTVGQKLSLVVTLMDDPEKYPVEAEVIWSTPAGAQGNKAAGVGVQFQGGEAAALRRKIEGLVAAYASSDKPTHTF